MRGQDRARQDRTGECVPSEEFPMDALSITPHSNSPNLSSQYLRYQRLGSSRSREDTKQDLEREVRVCVLGERVDKIRKLWDVGQESRCRSKKSK